MKLAIIEYRVLCNTILITMHFLNKNHEQVSDLLIPRNHPPLNQNTPRFNYL